MKNLRLLAVSLIAVIISATVVYAAKTSKTSQNFVKCKIEEGGQATIRSLPKSVCDGVKQARITAANMVVNKKEKCTITKNNETTIRYLPKSVCDGVKQVAK